MKTFKVLGLLLTYPKEEWLQHLDALSLVVDQEALLDVKQYQGLRIFMQWLRKHAVLDLQETYVATFDRSRSLCLHLFEHVHGESRDRGQAMIDLLDMYQGRGLYMDKRELPDYLPVFLEYLSLCQHTEALELLDECAHIIAALKVSLTNKQSPYAAVMAALENMASASIDKVKIEEQLKAKPQDPETMEELDEQWREAPAFEGSTKIADQGEHQLQYNIGIK